MGEPHRETGAVCNKCVTRSINVHRKVKKTTQNMVFWVVLWYAERDSFAFLPFGQK